MAVARVAVAQPAIFDNILVAKLRKLAIDGREGRQSGNCCAEDYLCSDRVAFHRDGTVGLLFARFRSFLPMRKKNSGPAAKRTAATSQKNCAALVSGCVESVTLAGMTLLNRPSWVRRTLFVPSIQETNSARASLAFEGMKAENGWGVGDVLRA